MNLKKNFPKIKKKLTSFLMDESWKITKENILTMSVGAMLLTGFFQDNVSWSSHTNYYPTHSSTWSHVNYDAGHVNVGHGNTLIPGHASGSVNGGVNTTPNAGHASAGHVSGNAHGNGSTHYNNSAAHSNYTSGDDGS